MKTTLENILELLESGDVYLSSEDHRSCVHLVHDQHKCFIKIDGGPEQEMKMSDDLVIKIMLNGDLSTREEYYAGKYQKQ